MDGGSKAWLLIIASLLVLLALDVSAAEGVGRATATVVRSQSAAILPAHGGLHIKLSGEPNRTFTISQPGQLLSGRQSGVADRTGKFEFRMKDVRGVAIVY